ncbi:unnamed protein product [Trichogramma brassicae]|uniref:Uncharacterized protein n=1 Tax=Trichogramma brassicae TaxID=86971 RepID=A0A6H5J4H9_9HYME|nr:unnamed protein product [Trichogramma brassicae]
MKNLVFGSFDCCQIVCVGQPITKNVVFWSFNQHNTILSSSLVSKKSILELENYHSDDDDNHFIADTVSEIDREEIADFESDQEEMDDSESDEEINELENDLESDEEALVSRRRGLTGSPSVSVSSVLLQPSGAYRALSGGSPTAAVLALAATARTSETAGAVRHLTRCCSLVFSHSPLWGTARGQRLCQS